MGGLRFRLGAVPDWRYVDIDYDFEFLEDGNTIEVISLGMVREDGKEYYAVNKDMPLERIRKNAWLMQNVMNSLPVRFDRDNPWDEDHPDFDAIKTKDQIAADVRHFVMDTINPSLWAWFAAYDHVAISQLFGRMIDLPAGFPMRTNDIAQEEERLGYPPMPEQPSGVHNALSDARFNQVRRHHLKAVAQLLGRV